LAEGRCKIKDGWTTQDSVIVKYEDGTENDIPESQYRSLGYQPPVEKLPECPQPVPGDV
jgi:hypothetical protein